MGSVIADVVGPVEPHEGQPLVLQRQKTLHNAFTSGMDRVV
nr:hypothetical protein [Mesorhizobium sp.]